jgi:hypothetical protein
MRLEIPTGTRDQLADVLWPLAVILALLAAGAWLAGWWADRREREREAEQKGGPE